ncbi:uncharacterized protein CBL_12292 [Carabus blaptoides fortunei]
MLFATIKSHNSKVLDKVVFMNGDITLSNFGLSPEDYNRIIEQTNIVYHSAAAVKFVLPLHEIVPLNIVSTKTMIGIAKKMNNLQALIHVSTAYVFCDRNTTDETVQTVLYTPEFLINLTNNMTKEKLDQITPALLGTLPNTYILTKQVAEQFLYEAHENIPVAIYRPAGIMPTYREPLPGWTNSYYAGIGIGVVLATGSSKVLHLNNVARFDMLPVDMAVNCMIAAAWDTAVRREKQVKIFNHFTEENAIYFYQYLDAVVNSNYQLESAIRYPGYIVATSSWKYNICVLFIETIPNALVDMVCAVLGKNVNCSVKCKRGAKSLNVLKYFYDKNFNFQTKNIPTLWQQLDSKDRELFNFDSYSINWNEYLQIICCGLKKILFKEDMNKLDKVRSKHKLLHLYEYLIIILYGAVTLTVLYMINII